MLRLGILLVTILLLTTLGCLGDDERQLRHWQQEQVAELQQQAQQNTAAAQALVTADAQARQELVALERDLQAERAEIGRQRDAMEAERKTLARQRQQVPLIAAALRGLGLLLLCALPLAVCWLLLRDNSREADSSELEDLLVLDLAHEAKLVEPCQLPTPMLERSALGCDSEAGESETPDPHDQPPLSS